MVRAERVLALAAVAALGSVLAGCGHSSRGVRGSELYRASGCGSCHTLAAARTSGTAGPSLDAVKPSYANVLRWVTRGGGEMPGYRGTLSPKTIRALATFVSREAGRSSP